MNICEAEQRAAVVAEARRWLGTPYHHAARVRGAGVDCAMLPAAVYRTAGLIPDFTIERYPPDWHLHRDTERYLDIVTRHATEVFGEPIPVCGTPLYTDARLFSERGIPAVIYGAGPRTVLESNAKRADEHIVLEDLRKATKVVARTLYDLLKSPD